MKIENAKIEDVSITMADHGCLTFWTTLKGNGWVTKYGGYAIGYGYLGSETFEGSSKGLEAMMRIMDTVGVDRWEDLPNHYVRVEYTSLGVSITKIGNIIKDKWFDIKEFFSEKRNRGE